MKALSLKQPWAWAVFHGKDVENRTWKTNYRGTLLIHASQIFDWDGWLWMRNNRHKIGILAPPKALFTKGAILGMVNIVDCVKHHASPWFFGPYGFMLKDPSLLGCPIPYKGQLGIFEIPDEILFRNVASSDK